MKIIKSAAVCALLGSSILSTPAFAFPDGTAEVEDPAPVGITIAEAQAVCTQLAANNGPDWTGTLDPSSIDGEITSGPTANGDRVIDQSSVEPGDGAVQIPQSVQVIGDPFRIGGSVNMFGFAQVVNARWSFSQHDFTAPYVWESTYTFTCNMTETVQTPDLGLHRWTGPEQAAQSAKDECVGTNSAHVYDDRGANCEWYMTVPGGPVEEPRDPETGTIGPVSEGGTLVGHESMGPEIPVNADEIDLPPMQVVVCISPGKKGGTWTNKNGYTGSLCTTNWYNSGAMNQPSPYDNLNTGSNNIVTIPSS